jgi:hypothetical protein
VTLLTEKISAQLMEKIDVVVKPKAMKGPVQQHLGNLSILKNQQMSNTQAAT